MRHLVLGLALVTALGPPAEAAESPSESHTRAATELLQVMDVERSMSSGVAAFTDAMIQQNLSLAPYRDVMIEWAQSFMTWENFGPRFVDIYVESFTEGELRDMTAFYRTPTGRKALDLMPELMRRGAVLGGQIAQEHSADLERRIRERTADLEKLPAKPAPPQEPDRP